MLRIVTDGAGDIIPSWGKEYGIDVIPVNILFGENPTCRAWNWITRDSINWWRRAKKYRRPPSLHRTSSLSEPDRVVRRVATDALGAIGEAAGTVALIRTLGDFDGDVRMGAVLALGKIGQRGDRTVVVPLISRVTDEKTEVRRAAIEALKAIGDRRAVVAMVAALRTARLGSPNAETSAIPDRPLRKK